jgi:hypothetical protein
MNSGPPAGTDPALLICIRIPKSGSASLARGLAEAFAERRIFYLPNTLDPDSRVSRLQRLRFWRARFQNIFRHHRNFGFGAVCARIGREAAPGDLVMGGHIDFRTARSSVARPLRAITLLREPDARARSEYDYMRRSFSRKAWFNRFDASVLHKAAGRYDFDSYLDYLFDLRDIYGDIASQYLGWDGQETLSRFSAHNVFHWGVLERSTEFSAALSEKLGRAFSLPQENRVDTPRADITRSQRARLEQIYAHDLELYAWVKANRR